MGNTIILSFLTISICLAAIATAKDSAHIRPPNYETCQRFCYTTCEKSSSSYGYCKDSLKRCNCLSIPNIRNPLVLGGISAAISLVCLSLLCFVLLICCKKSEKKGQRNVKGPLANPDLMKHPDHPVSNSAKGVQPTAQSQPEQPTMHLVNSHNPPQRLTEVC